MKVSVCITVFNEEVSILKLLDSLLKQTKKPTEIVILDGGSTDKTVEIIKSFQKKDKRIKLIVEKCSRSKGRNLAVESAKNEIIAITDAGCIAKKDWLGNITEPFKNKSTDVVAGFYDMLSENSMQKAMSVFLGVLPSQFNDNFLPSTRSVAFRKSVWKKVGGFPENLDDTAEDTIFNYKLVKEGVKIKRVKNARVEWGMPKTLKEFSNKICLYAKGDAKSGVLYYPTKGIKSHNVKSVLKLFRYILFFILIYIGLLTNVLYLFLFILIIFFYTLYSFNKVYILTNDIKAGLWGIVLQYITDISGIHGFIIGKFS